MVFWNGNFGNFLKVSGQPQTNVLEAELRSFELRNTVHISVWKDGGNDSKSVWKWNGSV